MRASLFALLCAALSLIPAPASSAADAPPTPVTGLKGNVNAAQWTPDGKTLVVAGARGLFMVDPVKAEVTRWVELNTSLESLALSPDGKLAAVGQSDGTIVIYLVADGNVRTTIPAKELTPERAPVIAGFTPDGATVIGGGKGAGVWNVADGKLLKSIPFPQSLHLLSLSPDGKTLLAVSRHGGNVNVYDVTKGTLAANQPEVKKGTPQEFNPNPSMVNDMGFTPDGKKFYAGGFMTGGLYFFTVADGKQAGRLKLESYQRGSFSKDGSKLAWGSWDTKPGAKNAVTISDAKSGAPLKQFPSATMTLFSALSPDGSTLFVLPQGGGSAVLYKLK